MAPPPNIFDEAQVLVNFDFIDFANGVGFEKFFTGGQAISGATINFKLSNQVFNVSRTGAGINDSQAYSSAVTTGHSSATRVLDLDFDSTTFTLPRALKGTMISNIPVASTTNTTSNSEAFVVMILKTVAPGGAEIIVATTTSTTLVTDISIYGEGGAENTYFAFGTPITKTEIKKGHFLRITLELWLKQVSGVDASWSLGHDPNGNVVTRVNVPTVALARAGFPVGQGIMTFFIPFEVNI